MLRDAIAAGQAILVAAEGGTVEGFAAVGSARDRGGRGLRGALPSLRFGVVASVDACCGRLKRRCAEVASQRLSFGSSRTTFAPLSSMTRVLRLENRR